jgi:hypothetical protein
MRHLNGVYTQAYNRNHCQDGHVFKGRFKSVLVEKESHLLELCRYVVLNPVRAVMVERPDQYPWSSYLPTLGKGVVPAFLCTEWVLANFSATLTEARRRYRRFVKDGMGLQESPWEKLCGQVILGTATFVEQVRERFSGKEAIREIPRHQRHAGRPELEALFPAGSRLPRQERNRLIRIAHGRHGYSLTEIARALDIHYTTVSKVMNAESDISRPDPIM